MTAIKESKRLQLWPQGTSVEYRGDVNGGSFAVQVDDKWRPATEAERRAVHVEELAEMYAGRDVLCCDSCLVTGLLQHAEELSGELGAGWNWEVIANEYPDPEDWSIVECREWLDDHQIEWPITPEELGDLARTGRDETGDTLSDDDLANKGHLEYLVEVDEIDRLDEDEWQDAVRDNAKPAEVLEWWRVSDWLCRQLRTIGEPVIDNGYGYWWGRTTSGQGLIMDGVLQSVARNVLAE